MARILSAVLKSSCTIIKAYFSWILPNANNPRKTPISIKFKKLKNFTNTVNKNLKLEFHISGEENASSDIYGCFIPNHLSAYDPLAVITGIKKPTTFLSKVENKKIPFVGKIISSMEGLCFDRKDLKESLNVMQKIENDLAEQNKNWIVFPEGTRNRDSNADLLEFHKGIFRSIMKAKAPIIPTAIFGSQNVLSDKLKLKRYPIYISFLKPLYASDYQTMSCDEVCKYCKDVIQKEVNELREKFNTEIVYLYKRRPKVKNVN